MAWGWLSRRAETSSICAYSDIGEIDDPPVAAMATLLIVFSVVLVAVLDRVLGPSMA